MTVENEDVDGNQRTETAKTTKTAKTAKRMKTLIIVKAEEQGSYKIIKDSLISLVSLSLYLTVVFSLLSMSTLPKYKETFNGLLNLQVVSRKTGSWRP